MGSMHVKFETMTGTTDLPIDVFVFSAMRCFAQAESRNAAAPLYESIARILIAEPGPVALYGVGPLLDAVLASTQEMSGKVSAIVDPKVAPGNYRGIPLISHWQSIPKDTCTIFLCELLTEPRWRLRREIGTALNVLCPDVLFRCPELIPQEAWVAHENSIYPMSIPSMEIGNNLDLVLLDLPARNGFAFPLSLGYVHKALKKIPGLMFQTLDADAILYHRFHIWRLFDFGESVVLENGRPLDADPWVWPEECWMDPRVWNSLLAIFAKDIDELVTNLVTARPKVLAMTVHQRNEWIARVVARRVKSSLPDTQILVGGHSCVSHTVGPKAFPEFDYMVIGEAEGVLGDIVQLLVAGERPQDLPGVIGRNDSSGRLFTPSCPPQNLDEIGPPSYDWIPDVAIFRRFKGDSTVSMYLTRGCIWGRCTFCSERFPFRTRSAKAFVDELERFCQMGFSYFNFSESDFGGQTEVLDEVADEILRRGLKLLLSGQLRINTRHDIPFLKKIVAAGIECNFGIDALTPHTLKLQRKGYAIETVKECLSNCKEAGIRVLINLVVGVPGETEQDVDDTIQFILDNRDMISVVFNISPFYLAYGNIYWYEPEKHGIRFLDKKDTLYTKYFYGIPDRYWYSTAPYIDGAVRRKRAYKILAKMHESGIPVHPFAESSVMRPMFDGFQNFRDFCAEVPSLMRDYDVNAQVTEFPTQFMNRLHGRSLLKVQDVFWAVQTTDIPAFQKCTRVISTHP